MTQLATHGAVDRRRIWALKRLADVLDPSEISTAPDDLEAHATDWSGHRLPGAPLAVLRPASTSSVQAALRVASAAGVTVIPRGRGTGLSGGAAVPDGALVLSTERLTQIVRIDPVDQVAVVQPGVVTADLDAAAARYGLRYAPDPASSEMCTIGGNVATNAGGLHCVKYGVTRESVLGLTAVLADGSLLRTGRQTIKGVVGYDLTALFVGSEGTLGVIVEVIVRLRPRPTQTRTAVAFFDTVAAAATGVTSLSRHGVTPSVLELLDRGALRSIDATQGTDLSSRGAALVLAQTDGFGADAEIAALGAALQSAGAAVEYPDEAAADRFLWLRRSGRGPLTGVWAVGEDIAVPRSGLVSMLSAIEDIGRRHDLDVAVVAHVGDGNLHPLLSTPRRPGDGEAPQRLQPAADELVRTALALGGTISGEHGVGITKREWLEAELGPKSVALQRKLKQVFDPTGVLNPHTWLAEQGGEARLTPPLPATYGDNRS
jgi:glycolate oxidase